MRATDIYELKVYGECSDANLDDDLQRVLDLIKEELEKRAPGILKKSRLRPYAYTLYMAFARAEEEV